MTTNTDYSQYTITQLERILRQLPMGGDKHTEITKAIADKRAKRNTFDKSDLKKLSVCVKMTQKDTTMIEYLDANKYYALADVVEQNKELYRQLQKISKISEELDRTQKRCCELSITHDTLFTEIITKYNLNPQDMRMFTLIGLMGVDAFRKGIKDAGV